MLAHRADSRRRGFDTWIGRDPRLVQGMFMVSCLANARSTVTGSPSKRDVRSSSRLCSTTFPPDRDALRLDPSLPAALLTKRLSSRETIGVNSRSIGIPGPPAKAVLAQMCPQYPRLSPITISIGGGMLFLAICCDLCKVQRGCVPPLTLSSVLAWRKMQHVHIHTCTSCVWLP